MIIRTRIETIDDVILSIPVSQFKVILGQIERMGREACVDEDRQIKERNAHILEYARTGKIAEFDQTISEADLEGHSSDCSVWNHNDLFGGTCSCGKWTA